jgi:hypothetical protein
MALPPEHLLDELATAYIQAVVAAAGATIAIGRLDYGVDGTIRRVVRVSKKESEQHKFIPSGFPVDFQLKGTSVASEKNGYIIYDLKTRNYDMIVSRVEPAIPLYLFLVCFHSEIDKWLTLDSERLILNASAYWWRESSDQIRNSTTVRLHIPATRRLTVNAVIDLLEASKGRFMAQ